MAGICEPPKAAPTRNSNYKPRQKNVKKNNNNNNKGSRRRGFSFFFWLLFFFFRRIQKKKYKKKKRRRKSTEGTKRKMATIATIKFKLSCFFFRITFQTFDLKNKTKQNKELRGTRWFGDDEEKVRRHGNVLEPKNEARSGTFLGAR